MLIEFMLGYFVMAGSVFFSLLMVCLTALFKEALPLERFPFCERYFTIKVETESRDSNH